MATIDLTLKSLGLHKILGKNGWVEAKFDMPKNGMTRQQVKTTAELLARRMIQMNQDKFQDADIIIPVKYSALGRYHTGKQQKLNSFNFDVYNIKEEYNGVATKNKEVGDKIDDFSLIIKFKK